MKIFHHRVTESTEKKKSEKIEEKRELETLFSPAFSVPSVTLW